MSELWVLGAGGHAKVVIDAARMAGRVEVAGVLDDDPALIGSSLLGVPVRGPIDLASVERFGVESAVIGIGNNRVRAQIVARFGSRLHWCTVLHPSAIVAASARLGEGAVILAGAIIQPDAAIGRHVIVNTSASIDHDCVIADFAHLAPGVRLAGNVTVDEGGFLGIGSCAIPGSRIGSWSTVGAGGVVVRNVESGAVVKGVPAR